MKIFSIAVLASLAFLVTPAAKADSVATLKALYQSQGAKDFNREVGEALWHKILQHRQSGQQRSCVDCHGKNLKLPGKHIRTGKVIEPLAPSVNPKRFSDQRKVEKWFTRNCKWTLGRECSSQEKGDLLVYLSSQ
ncbi:MAG: DUF1924 domain-containing protein [gamma proteobacterium endosymbiont of Lamellibrachia anaximandri]|nr:DUF1924 domain-containing protein [gamma proteobacterium endosymbiont of Lamellibrachia anaximandri]MBL3533064.1 DUF1924 domain-containing protein [gamma proteobacterium endosymbiont of Lamellibrachia anaximandri]